MKSSDLFIVKVQMIDKKPCIFIESIDHKGGVISKITKNVFLHLRDKMQVKEITPMPNAGIFK